MELHELSMDVEEAWHQLVYNHVGGYDIDVQPLTEWEESDLIYARTYIGRELSRRELARNPDATKSLLQEESPSQE